MRGWDTEANDRWHGKIGVGGSIAPKQWCHKYWIKVLKYKYKYQFYEVLSTFTDLRLIHGWRVTMYFVGKASAMGQPARPTQPSIGSGSVNE